MKKENQQIRDELRGAKKAPLKAKYNDIYWLKKNKQEYLFVDKGTDLKKSVHKHK